VEKQSAEVDKLDLLLVDTHKEVLKAVEDYGKVSFGPSYLKKLEIRLIIIENRLVTNLSKTERRELA
jgi:hypothetical protein